ncbi:hypothetical protein AZE42_08465 [Rhizopogon vesiculosus]|uniref:Uncharacterized protein n=1 Tax=Rhizopogon vesiculosus TaxID=180088 RepID=A0A1J8Q7A3_9AGAM|nr:hypothetical protein AZE42_08465 [Rhizopogon vesiculosus]
MFKLADRVLMLNPVCTQVLTRPMSRPLHGREGY